MKRFLLFMLTSCLLLCCVTPVMADSLPATVAIMENRIVSLSDGLVVATDPDVGRSTLLLTQDVLAAAKIDSISVDVCTLVNGADGVMLIDHRTQLLHIWKNETHSTMNLAAADFADGFAPIQAVQTGNLVYILLQGREANQILLADLQNAAVTLQPADHVTMIAPWTNGQILALRSPEADYSELIAIDYLSHTEVLFGRYNNMQVTGLAADPATETYYFIVKDVLCQVHRSAPDQINHVSELSGFADTYVQAAANEQWYLYRHPEHNSINFIQLPQA